MLSPKDFEDNAVVAQRLADHSAGLSWVGFQLTNKFVYSTLDR